MVSVMMVKVAMVVMVMVMVMGHISANEDDGYEVGSQCFVNTGYIFPIFHIHDQFCLYLLLTIQNSYPDSGRVK